MHVGQYPLFHNHRGKIPDFLLHLPNSKQNLAVIEFKLANNLGELESDLEKLAEFKKNEDLQYDYGVEVIIGNTQSLKRAKTRIEKLRRPKGEEITIIYFDNDSGKADSSSLKFTA